VTSSVHASIRRTVSDPSRWLVWIAALAYAVGLSAACLARHRAFVSGGYDLGIFDQATWLLGHADAPFSTIRGRNLFADHFQPALVLLAPLGRIGSSPAGLLVLQASLLAAAAPALAGLARVRGAAPWLALAVGLMWLASPLTQWANLFDYHPETAVPVLLAVGALALERRRDWAFVATALLASSLKEDVCLVYLMWGIVLAWDGRRRFGASVAVAGAAWFVLATKIVIPAFGGNLDYYSSRFGGDRGATLGSVFVSLVEHPLRAAGDAATTSNAKILIALVLCSGGLALLAPRLLLLAVPGLAANILSAYPYQHDLHFQYQLVPAAAFAVASAYGAGVATARFSARTVRIGAGVLIAGALAVTLVAPATRRLRAPVDDPVVAAKRHAVSLIPPGVSVAAAPDLAAHLARRHDVYQLPEPYFSQPSNGEYWSDAELARRRRGVRYVAYDTVADPAPRSQIVRIPAMLRREGFVEIFHAGDVRVFERRAG